MQFGYCILLNFTYVENARVTGDLGSPAPRTALRSGFALLAGWEGLRSSSSLEGDGWPTWSLSRSFFFFPPEADEDGFRTVCANNFLLIGERGFASKELRLAKSTLLNFIPRSLFEQFRHISKSYCLIIVVISFIADVSPLNPITHVLPLLIVVDFGFPLDIYEDRKPGTQR